MLNERVFTSAVLGPLVVLAVLLLPTLLISVMLGAVGLLGAWEWSALAGWRNTAERLAYVGIAAALMALVMRYLNSWGNEGLLAIGLGWWCIACASVVAYQLKKLELPHSPWLRGLAGLLTVIPSWGAMVSLHGSSDEGPYLLLFLVLLVWAADIGAYVVGRRFGRHHLADRVSPGKTWEGVVGSLGGTALVAGAGMSALIPSHIVAWPFLVLCMLTGLVSIIGDLLESQFKRSAGVKDSGNLLPGHGGVLDRIDSLTAAAPFFVFGVMLLGIKL
ncbi:MAG: phosphatidate cytidylyltransferase [Gammaproteobacteria bacterium]